MADKKQTAASYRFVGDHPDVLANGRPVEPGEFVNLTDEDVRDPYNETLIHDGRLIGANPSAEHQVSLAKSRVTRRLNGETAEEETPDESKEG